MEQKFAILPPEQATSPVSRGILQPPDEQLVGSSLWWLTAGKLVAGTAQLIAGGLQKAVGAVWDSIHGFLDVPGYIRQAQLISLASGETQQATPGESRFSVWSRIKNRAVSTNKDQAELKKSSYRWISLPALGALAFGAANVATELNNGMDEHSSFGWSEAAHLGTAGAAMGVTLGLIGVGANMKRKLGKRDNPHPELRGHIDDFNAHARIDGASSAMAMAEAGLHATGDPRMIVAANTAIMGLAFWQFWRFRPWKAGKESGDAAGEKHDHDHSNEVHSHGHHDHGECGHAHLVPHEVIDTATRLGRLSKAAGSLALSKVVDTGNRIAGASRNRRQAKKEERQAEIWLQWLEDTSNPDTPLGRWATSKLASDKDENDQWKHRKEQTGRRTSLRRRWQTALAAGTAAVALGLGMVSDTADRTVEAEPSAPEGPVAVQPMQPHGPVEEARPQEPAPFTEAVQVAPGDSQWDLAERNIERVTRQPAQASLTKIVAALAAAENAPTNPNPHRITAGQSLAVLSDEAVRIVRDAFSDPGNPLQSKLEELVQADWDDVIRLVDKSGINIQIQKVAGSI